MDRRLLEAVLKGDVAQVKKLKEEDEGILKQRVPGSQNTILHLAVRFGHGELAAEMVKMDPEMAVAENGAMETSLHEACREGRVEIVKLLLEIEGGAAFRLNRNDQSALFVACERGRIEVVKHFLMNNSFYSLLMLESDAFTTSLHAAASSGHTEIVKEILKIRPDFAKKRDVQGCTPLHLACSKGHLDITRELLKLDVDISALQDNEGRTPLHWAAIKGKINIIVEILSLSLQSAEMTTNFGETILHLAVKGNQFEVLKYLMETLNVTTLMNMQDSDGNTILHLATSRKLTSMVTYLLKLGVYVNALNQKGYTALDVVEADASNSGALAIIPALLAAGAKRCDQLAPLFQADIQHSPDQPFPGRFSDEITVEQRSSSRPNIYNNSTSLSPPHHGRGGHRGYRHPSYKKQQSRRRAKHIELQNEGLRNARKTIIIVAVLIATVTFAAGINPPGGFSQESGIALRGKNTSFKVFLVCDVLALFLSLGIVNVLVSVISFKRKSLMCLLFVTHKVMWTSTMFMASAFIAGVWTIMPRDRGARWVSMEVVVVGGGCTLLVILGLGLMLVMHWYNKLQWRKGKEKKVRDGSPNSSAISRVEEMKTIRRRDSLEMSSNSDVESSDHGYHLY